MYTIIGGDGKEYGPVSAEQVRAWIAAGRASPDTRAKALGTDTWRRLADFPAFGGSGDEPPVIATAATTATAVDAEGIAADLIGRAAKLDIGSCYERSWNLLKAHLWSLVGTSFLIAAVSGGLSFVPHVGFAGAMLFGGVFNGGLYYFFLLKIRGRPATLSDAFAGFSVALVPLMLAGLAVSSLTFLGCVALLLPGIYLAVSYAFTYMLVIDQKLSFWTAMEVSRRVITAQWWRVFGLMLLAIPFALLGVALLLVGLLFALPLIVGALVYAYEDLCHPPSR